MFQNTLGKKFMRPISTEKVGSSGGIPLILAASERSAQSMQKMRSYLQKKKKKNTEQKGWKHSSSGRVSP
jgi:hypothetical protein